MLPVGCSYIRDDSSDRQLWSVSFGANVADHILIFPPPASDPRYLTNVNGRLFFSAYEWQYGRELWAVNSGERLPSMLAMSTVI